MLMSMFSSLQTSSKKTVPPSSNLELGKSSLAQAKSQNSHDSVAQNLQRNSLNASGDSTLSSNSLQSNGFVSSDLKPKSDDSVANLKQYFDERLQSLEDKIDKKFDKLFQLLEDRKKSNCCKEDGNITSDRSACSPPLD